MHQSIPRSKVNKIYFMMKHLLEEKKEKDTHTKKSKKEDEGDRKLCIKDETNRARKRKT